MKKRDRKKTEPVAHSLPRTYHSFPRPFPKPTSPTTKTAKKKPVHEPCDIDRACAICEIDAKADAVIATLARLRDSLSRLRDSMAALISEEVAS